MSERDYDVLVVGGGPAGTATATWLARDGWRVGLVDRARFPRDKACGEFLTPRVRELLTCLGAWEAAQRAGARPVAATVLVAPGGRRVRHAPAHGGPAGYALRRIDLDAVLLEHARDEGVDVQEGVAVRDLCRDSHGDLIAVTGRRAGEEPVVFRARLVVGADGAHSLVARRLGLVRPLPRLQRVAIVSHWRHVVGPADTIEMRASGDVVCGLGFPGEGGRETGDRVSPSSSFIPHPSSLSFPPSSGACANLSLVVPTFLAARIAGRAGEFVEETIQTLFPDLADRLAGASCESELRTVGCFGHVCRPAVADGVLLVGDAATFIDPFTGEGVYFALQGARLAAEVAGRALKAGDTSRSHLLPYNRSRREMARRYLLCDVVQAIVRAPALMDRVVRRLERFPDAADRLLSVLGDIRPPTDTLHPGFLWRLLAPELRITDARS